MHISYALNIYIAENGHIERQPSDPQRQSELVNPMSRGIILLIAGNSIKLFVFFRSPVEAAMQILYNHDYRYSVWIKSKRLVYSDIV